MHRRCFYCRDRRYSGNSRNGHTKKTVKSQFGEIPLDIPRDTNGEFEPVIVKKYERTISNSLEDMIVSLFAQEMSSRDIEQHMRKIYGIDVSPEMVTRITDKILCQWRSKITGFWNCSVLYIQIII